MPTDPRVLRRMPWIMGLTFGTLGAVMPYLALELRARGLTGEQLTLTMTALPLARVLLGPLWGVLADRFQAEGATLRAATGVMASGVAILAMGPASLAWLGAVVFTFGTIGTIPVLDGLTLKALDGDSESYGRVRRWGSLGFLLLVLISGSFREETALSSLWLGLATALGASALTWGLPAKGGAARVAVLPALRLLAQDRVLLLLLLSSGLHMAGMAVYEIYYAVLAADLGLGTALTGLALAGGIVVEIALMTHAKALLQRLGPARLYLIAVVVSVPRWLGTAWLGSGEAQVALQLIHGVGFGAAWLGMVALVSQRAPREIASSAQGLLGGTVGGTGAILGTALGGALLDAYDAPTAFLGAAGLAGSALLLGGLALSVERRGAAA
ncbi:MAG: MFS transporter [Alphaproteobacteria bacterium]|nr:MFS transporter [Alphaproteobacteria bacterium]